MRPNLTTVTWRFRDSSTLYPEIPTGEKAYIRGPRDVFDRFRSLFDGHVRERFVVFWLNSQNRVMGFEVMSEGTLNTFSSIHGKYFAVPLSQRVRQSWSRTTILLVIQSQAKRTSTSHNSLSRRGKSSASPCWIM